MKVCFSVNFKLDLVQNVMQVMVVTRDCNLLNPRLCITFIVVVVVEVDVEDVIKLMLVAITTKLFILLRMSARTYLMTSLMEEVLTVKKLNSFVKRLYILR